MEPGPRAAGEAFLVVVPNSPRPSCSGQGGGTARTGRGSQQEWVGVNTQTHSRHRISGTGLGGSWSGSDSFK